MDILEQVVREQATLLMEIKEQLEIALNEQRYLRERVDELEDRERHEFSVTAGAMENTEYYTGTTVVGFEVTTDEESTTQDGEPESNPVPRFIEFGCIGQNLSLSCSSGSIHVVDAFYGKYEDICVLCCKAPNPLSDCIENVEETRPSDWAAIKLLCDGQSSCVYEYQGSTVDSCLMNYVADYMEISYDCLPMPDVFKAAFTAYFDFRNSNYHVPNNTVLIYDKIVSNIGNGYNSKIGAFICPVDGVYMFSLTVTAGGTSGDVAEVHMYINHRLLNGAWARNRNEISEYNSFTAVVNVECLAGDRVWTVTYRDNVFCSWAFFNQFSGVLIDRYE